MTMPVAPATPSMVPDVGLFTVALLVAKLVVPSLTHSRKPDAWTAVGKLTVLAAGVAIETIVVSKFVAVRVKVDPPVTIAVVGAAPAVMLLHPKT